MADGDTGNDVSRKKPARDGGWGWVIVFASFMIHFIMDGITYTMSEIYLHPMREVLHSSRARVSTIFSLLPAITLAIGPIAAVFVQIWGCRKLTIFGACLAALGFAVSALYPNIWLYYIAIGIGSGIGFGFIYMAALVSVLDRFDAKRGLAMGIAVCGSGLGTMVFSWFMPYVINSPAWFDYSGALLNEAAVIFVCVIFGMLMIPEEASDKPSRQLHPSIVSIDEQPTSVDHDLPTTPSDTKHEEATNRADVQNDEKTPETSKQSFMHKLSKEVDFNLLKDTVLVLFILSNFLTSLSFNVPYNFADDLATDADIVEHRRRWIIMAIGISNCFGRVIIGRLADFTWVNRLVMYNIILIMAGLATMAAPLCGSLIHLHITYASFFGFFSGGYVCLTSIITEDLVGKERKDSAIGLLLLFQGVATGLGTPIVGAMRDVFSNFSQPYLWPYFLFGGFIIVSGIILFPISFTIYKNRVKKNLTEH